jgi:hypothetical protein
VGEEVGVMATAPKLRVVDGGAPRKNTNMAPTNGFTKLHNDFAGKDGMQRLSLSAQALLIALLAQYTGKNNGALKITAKVLGGRWVSNDVRKRARDELVREGFVVQLFQGHRPNRASLYAVTCFELDPHRDHDAAAARQFAVGTWKRKEGGDA